MIELDNFTDYKIDKDRLKNAVRLVLKKEKKDNFHICISLVNSEEIKRINKNYRKKNRVTDVLSFEWGDEFGEILISPDQLNRDNFKKEIIKVLIHGTLHLLDYDHENSEEKAKKMEEKEKRYFNEIFKNN